VVGWQPGLQHNSCRAGARSDAITGGQRHCSCGCGTHAGAPTGSGANHRTNCPLILLTCSRQR
jgi:hypothetical protein